MAETEHWGRPSEKVCIVVRTVGMADEIYCIYIVDLNEMGFERRTATIQLRGIYPIDMAYIVLNCTIYMFGGESDSGTHDKCFSYDLSKINDDDCLDMDFDSMDRISSIPSMASNKFVSRAVSILDGRICVFSVWLEPKDPNPCSSNFELYDPALQTWSSLLEPPVPFHPGLICEVTFYCVEHSTLFIATAEGSFYIDLANPLHWMLYHFPISPSDLLGNTQPVLKDGNLLLPPSFRVYDADDTTEPPLQLRWYASERFLHPRDRAIVRLLNQEDKERLRACIVEVGGCSIHEPDPVGDPVMRLTLLKLDEDDADDDDDLTASNSN